MARRTALLALVTAGAVLTGCGGTDAPAPAAQEGPGTREVVHALGTTTITGTPERVVVLDSGELDAVTALGVVPVGAVETGGLLDELAATHGFDAGDVTVVGSIAEPDLEAVAALQPDLILTNAVRHEALHQQLSALAPTVQAAELGAVWQENFLLDAEALGMTERAEEILADYERRVGEIGAAWGDPAATEVAVLRFMGGDEIRAYARGSFVGSVLEDVGFTWPAALDTTENRVELTAESLDLVTSDVVFWSPGFGDGGAGESVSLMSGELWTSLPPVQAGADHEVDDSRWFLGLGPTGAGLVLDDLAEITASR
ncbi:ABC transporter substrate-binding protein [Klenkia taihuensis]|uniref:Iron complex transport system substrate-binding protein n=1 Tax=Klenkia taihuensis TaxID=1225127 RepID=A0A1I1PB08_9ACTN|nr:iron-siderophore ABC transporter substrate-binding protein [Klenkia taihuensis]GHE11444.1 ABC transporter periplasmic component [Klenkia taihuensis]SFD04838.1 iron complex transport system substrate-binding protein [Klenkia taihuensis]